MKQPWKKWLTVGLLVAAIGAVGWLAWSDLQPDAFSESFASGNGRIEATEIDVATKLAGRLVELNVGEGDFVTAGQVLARMDTSVLEAQLAEAQAQIRQAENAHQRAQAMVALRASEKATAEAVVAQRQAELIAAQRTFARTEALAQRNVLTAQELDDDRAAMLSAEAARAAARAQVLSTDAGIKAAEAQVVEAESAIAAAQAGAQRIEADIAESILKAPRDGRVQYRVAQVGEVLPAGGIVLNMVDLSDVYMTFFLPTAQAGRVALGQEVRLVLDAVPHYVIPAAVTFVASVAQFTPKTVETESEREKLMFRVKAHIDPDLLREHLTQVKTGLPGMAYLRLDPQAQWPENLQINVPQ